jgi:hypothetical protein
MRGDEVEALAREVEAGLKSSSRFITRADVVPLGVA